MSHQIIHRFSQQQGGTPRHFSSWSSFASHLESLGLFRMKPGLDRMYAGIEQLGLSRASQCRAHIVGTNGKGSTAAFLESIARAHGRTTGLFTSPHFITPRERIRINGKALSEEEWIELANTVYASCPEVDFSYFELLTLMAVLAFERVGVEIVIMEAGLGGTWDATTAFHYDLTIITPIGLDHESILGLDVNSIATDKAGAITGGGVISGRQEESVLEIITNRTNAKGAKFYGEDGHTVLRNGHLFFTDSGNELLLAPENLGLKGVFQLDNALLALRGWSIFARAKGWSFLPLKCKEGLARVRHPGRMQIIQGKPTFLLDGAHNMMGMQALESSLHAMDFVPECIIFSCLGDKNIRYCLDQIKRLCPGQILVPHIKDNERAMDAHSLAMLMGESALECADMRDALTCVNGQDIKVLVCGSLYLLGDFFRARPGDFTFS